jgi:hypothetical protein
MQTEAFVAKPKRLVKQVLKVLVLVGVCLAALFFVARLIWRFSGSNQWEFVQEVKGVKIYSLKAPGLDLKQFKGIVRVRSTLASIIKFMQDPEICPDVGCHDLKVIERVDDQLQYWSFRYSLPFPFQTREFVTRVQVSQNQQTKEVLMWVAAAPDKTPPHDCCFRVTDMNNTWRLTPLENGQVDIEYVINMNQGGFVPDLFLNVGTPRFMLLILPNLQGFLNREKYRDAKFDFIKGS